MITLPLLHNPAGADKFASDVPAVIFHETLHLSERRSHGEGIDLMYACEVGCFPNTLPINLPMRSLLLDNGRRICQGEYPDATSRSYLEKILPIYDEYSMRHRTTTLLNTLQHAPRDRWMRFKLAEAILKGPYALRRLAVPFTRKLKTYYCPEDSLAFCTTEETRILNAYPSSPFTYFPRLAEEFQQAADALFAVLNGHDDPESLQFTRGNRSPEDYQNNLLNAPDAPDTDHVNWIDYRAQVNGLTDLYADIRRMARNNAASKK